MHRLQRLPLAERVEHRRDRADLQRVRAEEHQVVEHPVQLGQRHPQPDRPLGHLDAHQPFDGEHHAELVGERGQPVVPVGQHDDLPVVAHLEQLLGAAVHVADDRLAGDHPLAVEGELEPQHAVRGRVLRPDVEHHVGGVEAGAGPDRHLTCQASVRSARQACSGTYLDRPDRSGAAATSVRRARPGRSARRRRPPRPAPAGSRPGRVRARSSGGRAPSTPSALQRLALADDPRTRRRPRPPPRRRPRAR